MKFLGTKTNGKLVHPAAVDELKRRYWERVPEGSIVESTLTIKHKDKTTSQLGAIWGLMIAQAVEQLEDRGYDTSFIYNLPNPTGIVIDKDSLCHYFYQACPIRDEGGAIISLSKASTAQAANFFDDCRNFMASQWSIYIAEPNPNWKDEHGTE